MDSTKNVKGNRKMVEVCYTAPIIDFYEIPDGLDLEDKSIVEEYWVRYRTLYIKYVGIKDVEEHEPTYQDENDFKYPDSTNIVDADECHVNPYDDETDDDDDEAGDCVNPANNKVLAELIELEKLGKKLNIN